MISVWEDNNNNKFAILSINEWSEEAIILFHANFREFSLKISNLLLLVIPVIILETINQQQHVNWRKEIIITSVSLEEVR